MRLSYEEQLRGMTVLDSSGRAIGDVIAVFFDTESLPGGLAVESLRVRLRNEIANELGVAHGAFHRGTVDVPGRALQAIGDAVVLQVTVAALLARAPAESAPPPTP